MHALYFAHRLSLTLLESILHQVGLHTHTYAPSYPLHTPPHVLSIRPLISLYTPPHILSVRPLISSPVVHRSDLLARLRLQPRDIRFSTATSLYQRGDSIILRLQDVKAIVRCNSLILLDSDGTTLQELLPELKVFSVCSNHCILCLSPLMTGETDVDSQRPSPV